MKDCLCSFVRFDLCLFCCHCGNHLEQNGRGRWGRLHPEFRLVDGNVNNPWLVFHPNLLLELHNWWVWGSWAAPAAALFPLSLFQVWLSQFLLHSSDRQVSDQEVHWGLRSKHRWVRVWVCVCAAENSKPSFSSSPLPLGLQARFTPGRWLWMWRRCPCRFRTPLAWLSRYV